MNSHAARKYDQVLRVPGCKRVFLTPQHKSYLRVSLCQAAGLPLFQVYNLYLSYINRLISDLRGKKSEELGSLELSPASFTSGEGI